MEDLPALGCGGAADGQMGVDNGARARVTASTAAQRGRRASVAALSGEGGEWGLGLLAADGCICICIYVCAPLLVLEELPCALVDDEEAAPAALEP